MRLYSASKRREPTGLTSDSWLLSFGDLLTLLVCFFLLLTPHASSHAPLSQGNQHVKDLGATQMSLGTDLASSSFDQKGNSTAEVQLWHYPLGSTQLGATGEQRLYELFRQVEAGAAAQVKVCDAGLLRGVLSQSVTLLNRLGERASRVRFKVGGDCSEWRERSQPSERLVAVVQYSRD
jgi:hypothetical protein